MKDAWKLSDTTYLDQFGRREPGRPVEAEEELPEVPPVKPLRWPLLDERWSFVLGFLVVMAVAGLAGWALFLAS